MPQITTEPVPRDPNLLLISSKTMNYLVTDWRTDPGFLISCARICSYHRSQLSEMFFLKRFYHIPSPCSMLPSWLWQTMLMDQSLASIVFQAALWFAPRMNLLALSGGVVMSTLTFFPPWYLVLLLYQSWLHPCTSFSLCLREQPQV